MTWRILLKWLAPWLFIALVCGGCGESDQDPDANKPFTLAGASKALDALKANDYETVVSTLKEIRSSVDEKSIDEYRRLRGKINDQLIAQMPTSEAAGEAYRAITSMETGR